MKNIALIFIFYLSANSKCLAFIIIPNCKTYYSVDSSYRLFVTTPKHSKNVNDSIKYCKGVLSKKNYSGIYETIWESKLSNQPMPGIVFISPNGKSVITIDNYYGPDIISPLVIFDSVGKKIKTVSLCQISDYDLDLYFEQHYDWFSKLEFLNDYEFVLYIKTPVETIVSKKYSISFLSFVD